MPQSLVSNTIHLVFSTKNREARLYQNLRPNLFAVLATLLQDQKCFVHKIGGVDDHVHLAFDLHQTIAISTLVQVVKSESSKWVKEQPGVRKDFAWQKGYGAFSVGKSQVAALVRYVTNQEKHHRRASFQDEFRGLCEKYGIEIDERYVWD
jgi:REP element-mobilizing transposase RayT